MTQDQLNEILRLHKLWLENDSRGRKANLSGADLSEADLRDADLSFVDLEKTNLQDVNIANAKFDFSIYTFCLGKHGAVATKEYLQIGCQKHNWEYWFKNITQIGKANKYENYHIKNHVSTVKHFYKLLKREVNNAINSK